MPYGLEDSEMELLIQVFAAHSEIKEVVLFGSRALGTYRNNSDIDLVLYGEIDQNVMAAINLELDELPLPYLFDIKSAADITHVGLKEHIEKFGKKIYSI